MGIIIDIVSVPPSPPPPPDIHLAMMTDLCPICNVTVDKSCLQCDKCKDWIHYRCLKLPAYVIIQSAKSTRVFSCPSCVKSKYPLAFQKHHDDIEKIIMTPVRQSSSPKKHYSADPIHHLLYLSNSPLLPLFLQPHPISLQKFHPPSEYPLPLMIHPLSPNHISQQIQTPFNHPPPP